MVEDEELSTVQSTRSHYKEAASLHPCPHHPSLSQPPQAQLQVQGRLGESGSRCARIEGGG